MFEKKQENKHSCAPCFKDIRFGHDSGHLCSRLQRYIDIFVKNQRLVPEILFCATDLTYMVDFTLALSKKTCQHAFGGDRCSE